MKTFNIKLTGMALLSSAILIANVALGQNTNGLKLKISKAGYSDETIIRFLPAATEGFDGNYDAWKMFSPNTSVPSIFSKTPINEDLSINSYPNLTRDYKIDVYVKFSSGGNFQITAVEYAPFDSLTKIFLKDNQTGVFYDLKKTTAFTVVNNAADDGNIPRFSAYFSLPSKIAINNISCFGNGDGKIKVSKPGNSSFNYILKDSANAVLKVGTAINEEDSMNNLSAGTYQLLTENYGMSYDTIFFSIYEPAPVQAMFMSADTFELQGGSVNVNFTNYSVNALSYMWDFGDGNSSSDFSPTHAYQDTGIFTITLTAFDSACSKGFSKTILIQPEVIIYAQAGFTCADTSTLQGGKADVSFINNSQNADTYFWDFGDGVSSTDSLPVHTYYTAGTYTVTLTASNSNSSMSFTKTILIQPEVIIYAQASFTCTDTSILQGGKADVGFINNSQNANMYFWDFGDGGSSTDSLPVHTYYTAGTYTVTLTASNSNSSMSFTKTILIQPEVIIYAQASFTCADTSIIQGGKAEVNFINNSQNADTYFWDFGDGETSADSLPVHAYYTAGTYTVTLTASNNSSSMTVSRTIQILPESIVLSTDDNNGNYENLNNENADVMVFDLTGKLVFEGKHDRIAGLELKTGIYLLRIALKDRVITKKVAVI